MAFRIKDLMISEVGASGGPESVKGRPVNCPPNSSTTRACQRHHLLGVAAALYTTPNCAVGCETATPVTCVTATATGVATATPVACVTATTTTLYCAVVTPFLGAPGCRTATPVTVITLTPITCVTATATGCATATPVTCIGFTVPVGLCAVPSLPGGTGEACQGQSGEDAAAALQQLAELKAQLKEAIAQIDREEDALESSQKPQTVDEAESLQQKLRDAVDELENLKNELREKGR